MKKIIGVLLFAFAIIFAVNSVNAQEKSGDNFFIGKWKLMGYDLPQGDTEMIFTIEMKDGKLVGQMGSGDEVIPFTKIEINENEMTVYYNAQGFEVYTNLEKVDEDKVEGSIMDMFDIDGTRMSE